MVLLPWMEEASMQRSRLTTLLPVSLATVLLVVVSFLALGAYVSSTTLRWRLVGTQSTTDVFYGNDVHAHILATLSRQWEGGYRSITGNYHPICVVNTTQRVFDGHFIDHAISIIDRQAKASDGSCELYIRRWANEEPQYRYVSDEQ